MRTAELAGTAQDDIYYCLICGPCLRETYERGSTVVVHNNVPHPDAMTFDEEERPQ